MPKASQTSECLPSRLLYFDDDNLCRLVETDNKTFRYMALSCDWNLEPTSLQLTSATYSAFQQGIAYWECRVLKDALSIAKLAGIDYLWVDRLCIMQDNEKDWLSVASNMVAIYSNSLATLVASSKHERSPLPGLNPSRSHRRLNRGLYSCFSHGTPLFSQDWFSRIASAELEPLVEYATGTLGRNATSKLGIAFPHQSLNVSSLSRATHTGSILVDLPRDVVVNLHKLLESQDWPCSAHAESKERLHVATSDSERKSHQHRLLKNLLESTQDEQDIVSSVAKAMSSIQNGVESSQRGQTLQAIAEFIQARDYVTEFTKTSSAALQAHVMTSIYLAAVYLKLGEPNLSLKFLEASGDQKLCVHEPQPELIFV
jgi:hypothetical protein